MKIIVCSNGDSLKLKTWSNIPYLCIKALEEKGVKVLRVNIAKRSFFNPFVGAWTIILSNVFVSLKKLLFGINAQTTYNADRMKFCIKRVAKHMDEAIEDNSNADIQLVFSFSHISNNNSIPTIMMGDWTLEYFINEHQKRKPDYFEKRAIVREYEAMERAEALLTFFPNVYKVISEKFPQKTYYLGHFINSLEKVDDYNMEEIRRHHFESRKILFVGGCHYKTGVQILAEAIESLNKEHGCNYTLEIIGIRENELKKKYSCCRYHGYLDKENVYDRELYYTLFRDAKLFANVTSEWCGAGSIYEALYWGLPVMLHPNKDIVSMLDKTSSFTFWVKEMEQVKSEIRTVMQLDEDVYEEISLNAHSFVKDMTWDHYSEKIINICNQVISNRNVQV